MNVLIVPQRENHRDTTCGIRPVALYSFEGDISTYGRHIFRIYIAGTLPNMALKVIFLQAIGVNQSAGEENTRHIDPSPSIRELMVLGL